MNNADGLAVALDEAWTAFRQRLADRLSEMAEGETVLVQLLAGDADEQPGEAPYVHVTACDGEVLHAEVSSNYSLDERYELTDEAVAQVVALGWTHPDDDELDSIDFETDVPQGMADLLAVNSVRVLREVFGCVHPAFLDAAGLEPAPAVVPAPRPAAVEQDVVMPSGPAHLQELVDAALEVLFESPAKHDDDGDLPITCGKSVAFVRVHEDEPTVEVFAHLVLGVADLARAAQEVARLNRRSPHDQFLVREGRIEMRTALLAVPFCAEQLRHVVQRFCSSVDEYAVELVETVGGRRFLDDEPSAPVHPATEPGMMMLLELLHDGRVHPATVAGLFADDRRDLVRQIVRVRRGWQTLDGHGEDVVLDHLRRALRLVADREAGVADSPPSRRRPKPTRQLSLLTDEDLGEETLGASWG